MTPSSKRKPLVLGPRSVDAEVTPPPEGYVPAQASAPADVSPADNSASMPPADAAAADSSSGVTAPAGDAPDPRDFDGARDGDVGQQLDAIVLSGPHAGKRITNLTADEIAARNAQNDGNDGDDGDATAASTARPTRASDTMVQATKLAVRAFARHRDALPDRAERAARAIEDLRAAGGNDRQVAAVLDDADVAPGELDQNRKSWRPRR